jgi:hypothetical protein
MVTTKSMHHFAADCRIWAGKLDNPSQRQIVLDAARFWSSTADAIERLVATGGAQALPDFREKLN